MIRKGAKVAETNENEVTHNVIGWLREHGWICDRVQVGIFFTADGRRINIGKRGQPDWRCKHAQMGYFELEIKAPNRRPSPIQSEYIATMQHLGFVVIWVDGLVDFIAQYRRQYAE